MAKKVDSKSFGQDLGEGLKYPWNKARRLWNILWFLIPIFGWFALGGYIKKIVKELATGQRNELPAFGSFWNNFVQGVKVFVFLIPIYIVIMLISMIPFGIGTILYYLITIFIMPWLIMNFFVNETFNSIWELKKAFNIKKPDLFLDYFVPELSWAKHIKRFETNQKRKNAFGKIFVASKIKVSKKERDKLVQEFLDKLSRPSNS